MKKLLIALVLISLLCGVSYAIEPGQALVNEYAARNVGRAIVTDSSVMLKVWCKDSALPFSGVGVSSSTSIIIYRNYANGTQAGYTLDTSSAALDTVGEVVDYINTNFASDSSVKLNASVGPDAHRDVIIASELVPANIIASGTTQDSTIAQVLKQTNDRISAGVEAKDGTINRIKSVQASLTANDLGVTLRVYDGTTLVWRKYVGASILRTPSDNSNSANTVAFPESKGISSTVGNGIVAIAVADGNVTRGSATDRAINQIAIVYDQLKQ